MITSPAFLGLCVDARRSVATYKISGLFSEDEGYVVIYKSAKYLFSISIIVWLRVKRKDPNEDSDTKEISIDPREEIISTRHEVEQEDLSAAGYGPGRDVHIKDSELASSRSQFPFDGCYEVTRVDKLASARSSEATLSARSDDDSTDQEDRGVFSEHSYAISPPKKKRMKPAPKRETVEPEKSRWPNVDIATLAAYRSLIDHTYSSITPSSIIDAVMLKHNYICTIQNIEFQEECRIKARYVEEQSKRLEDQNKAVSSNTTQTHPKQNAKQFKLKAKTPKKAKTPPNWRDLLENPSSERQPAGNLAENPKFRRKNESPKRSLRIKVDKRETLPVTPKVSPKKVNKSPNKKRTINKGDEFIKKEREDENFDSPISKPEPEPEEETKKFKRRRRRNQTGWPTKYKSQPNKSKTSAENTVAKNPKYQPPKTNRKTKKARESSSDKHANISIKIEKDDETNSLEGSHVSIEEAVKRRRQKKDETKKDIIPVSPEKKVRGKRKVKPLFQKSGDESSLTEFEEGSPKPVGRKTKASLKSSLISCIKQEPQSTDDEFTETDDNSDIRSSSSFSRKSRRKVSIPTRYRESSDTQSSPTKHNTSRTKRTKEDDESPESCLPVSDHNENSAIGSPKNPDFDEDLSSHVDSPSSSLQKSVESTQLETKDCTPFAQPASPLVSPPRRSKRKTAKVGESTPDSPAASSRKSGSATSIMDKTKLKDNGSKIDEPASNMPSLPTEVLKTDTKGVDSCGDIVNQEDTSGNLVPNPKVRMSLRQRVKLQVGSLFKPRNTSKSKTPPSQPTKLVNIKKEVPDGDQGSRTDAPTNSQDGSTMQSPPISAKSRRRRKKLFWGHHRKLRFKEDPKTSSVKSESKKKDDKSVGVLPDHEKDETVKNVSEVDEELKRAELGLAIIKVESMESDFMFEKSLGQNFAVDGTLQDSKGKDLVSQKTDPELENLTCTEKLDDNSSGSIEVEESGVGKGIVEPEVVYPPLEHLDYTGWTNTKTIYTTDVSSDSEWEDECTVAKDEGVNTDESDDSRTFLLSPSTSECEAVPDVDEGAVHRSRVSDVNSGCQLGITNTELVEPDNFKRMRTSSHQEEEDPLRDIGCPTSDGSKVAPCFKSPSPSECKDIPDLDEDVHKPRIANVIGCQLDNSGCQLGIMSTEIVEPEHLQRMPPADHGRRTSSYPEVEEDPLRDIGCPTSDGSNAAILTEPTFRVALESSIVPEAEDSQASCGEQMLVAACLPDEKILEDKSESLKPAFEERMKASSNPEEDPRMSLVVPVINNLHSGKTTPCRSDVAVFKELDQYKLAKPFSNDPSDSAMKPEKEYDLVSTRVEEDSEEDPLGPIVVPIDNHPSNEIASSRSEIAISEVRDSSKLDIHPSYGPSGSTIKPEKDDPISIIVEDTDHSTPVKLTCDEELDSVSSEPVGDDPIVSLSSDKSASSDLEVAILDELDRSKLSKSTCDDKLDSASKPKVKDDSISSSVGCKVRDCFDDPIRFYSTGKEDAEPLLSTKLKSGERRLSSFSEDPPLSGFKSDPGYKLNTSSPEVKGGALMELDHPKSAKQTFKSDELSFFGKKSPSKNLEHDTTLSSNPKEVCLSSKVKCTFGCCSSDRICPPGRKGRVCAEPDPSKLEPHTRHDNSLTSSSDDDDGGSMRFGSLFRNKDFLPVTKPGDLVRPKIDERYSCNKPFDSFSSRVVCAMGCCSSNKICPPGKKGPDPASEDSRSSFSDEREELEDDPTSTMLSNEESSWEEWIKHRRSQKREKLILRQRRLRHKWRRLREKRKFLAIKEATAINGLKVAAIMNRRKKVGTISEPMSDEKPHEKPPAHTTPELSAKEDLCSTKERDPLIINEEESDPLRNPSESCPVVDLTKTEDTPRKFASQRAVGARKDHTGGKINRFSHCYPSIIRRRAHRTKAPFTQNRKVNSLMHPRPKLSDPAVLKDEKVLERVGILSSKRIPVQPCTVTLYKTVPVHGEPPSTSDTTLDENLEVDETPPLPSVAVEEMQTIWVDDSLLFQPIHPPIPAPISIHHPATENAGGSRQKMGTIGCRATTARENARRESQQIRIEHAYCRKDLGKDNFAHNNFNYSAVERGRSFEGNDSVFSSENHANTRHEGSLLGRYTNNTIFSGKLITNKFPLLVKPSSVTVNVDKMTTPPVVPSTYVPQVPDSHDLTGIATLPPEPAPKGLTIPTIRAAYKGGLYTYETKAGRNQEEGVPYTPPPEIARLDVLVRRRFKLPYSNCEVSYFLKKDGRPPFSYQTIAAMAIESDPLMAARASDVFEFMMKHFPFYRASTSKWWKHNVRTMLSTSKLFRNDRIGSSVYYSFCKELRLPGDPTIYEMTEDPPTDVSDQSEEEEEDRNCETALHNVDEQNDAPPIDNEFSDLFSPLVEIEESSEVNPFIPICSYSEDESDGFPVIVNAETYTGDELPPDTVLETGDQYESDAEIKEEVDEEIVCEEPTQRKEITPSSTTGGRVYPCPYCSDVFETLQEILDHSVVHPEVMKPCPLCDFSSPDDVQLSWHVNAAHNMYS
ncbi:hypothetical protein GE061_003446 [Apolygus lucorum]|uniref:Fork-head domain-containing protein n=1 Tax=Apolygus lucorum TaxID=248454 RepID=A0A8S9X265_APOLU|nr:hypothetical protein GE061_003446 [Apolygus lucorum]